MGEHPSFKSQSEEVLSKAIIHATPFILQFASCGVDVPEEKAGAKWFLLQIPSEQWFWTAVRGTAAAHLHPRKV